MTQYNVLVINGGGLDGDLFQEPTMRLLGDLFQTFNKIGFRSGEHFRQCFRQQCGQGRGIEAAPAEYPAFFLQVTVAKGLSEVEADMLVAALNAILEGPRRSPACAEPWECAEPDLAEVRHVPTLRPVPSSGPCRSPALAEVQQCQ
jgi:hypothetical protein